MTGLIGIDYGEAGKDWTTKVFGYFDARGILHITNLTEEKHMTFEALTQKGSMGFNSGAPKHQHPLTQGDALPVMVPDKQASGPVYPIQRVNEIGAQPPIGPIEQDQ